MSVKSKENILVEEEGEGGEQWVPVLQVFPKYTSMYEVVKSRDQYGTTLLHDLLQLQPQDAFVLMKPIPVSPITPVTPNTMIMPLKDHIFPFAMAWPFTITKGTTDVNGILAHGALLTLTDMFTSLHLMLALLPQFLGHVSVSIQCNTVQPMREGETIVAITHVDKIGKRLLFSSVEFLSATTSLTGLEEGERMDVIKTAIQNQKVCANAKHVKSILAPPPTASTGEKKE
ncbi:thioesterase superfamily protein [Trypanosoma theileri]|uniref:Thioesterase superfamily protein n=1 Tax=Trypanosoma theileri TaxID=67003 RepID=A0A1X0NXQ6_9TRYP|nr:thioesterase superfamily protein [Trypanosoma theileri]ORC89391.1 thioesterase superfamily protein [Trypanosoma theileri]